MTAPRKLVRHRTNRQVIKGAVRLLTPRERGIAGGLLALMMVAGVLESSVVAAVLPFVYILVDPERAASIPKVAELLAFLGVDPAGAMPILSIALIGLLLISAIVTSLANYLNEQQTEASRNRVAHALLVRVVDAPYLWVARRNSAVLVKTIFDDVRLWRRDCVQSLLSIVQAIILILFPAAVAVALAPMQGVAALGVLAVCSGFIMFLVRRPILRFSLIARDIHAQVMASLLQILNGVREIKVSRKTGFFLKAFDTAHAALNRQQVKVRLLSRMPASALTLVGQIGFIGIAWMLWGQGFSGAEITAQIAIVGVVVTRVLPAANRLNAANTALLGSLPYVEGLLDLIASAEKDRGWLASSDPDLKPLDRTWKRLEFEDVGFAFGEHSAGVKEVRLSFDRGKFYGVVGPSGAGKSTLMNLLIGLLAPDTGKILIDGVPRERCRPGNWLDQLAYVPQDVFMLDDTVAANIAFGNEQSDAEQRIQTALRVACLEEVVAAIPEGLETRLGERGRRFSGGQAQRVAIARAIFNGPTVLLMDEATSALDSITEERVQANIRNLGDDTLVIAIAHRISSLRACDEIIVLDGGKIVDKGPYTELLDRCPLFASLASKPLEDVQA